MYNKSTTRDYSWDVRWDTCDYWGLILRINIWEAEDQSLQETIEILKTLFVIFPFYGWNTDKSVRSRETESQMIRSHHTNQPLLLLLLAFHCHDLSIHPSMCFLSGTPQGQQSDKHMNPPHFTMCPIPSWDGPTKRPPALWFPQNVCPSVTLSDRPIINHCSPLFPNCHEMKSCLSVIQH